ncbi:MAG: ATP-binding cassette domain-containing protein [Candidatus Rifleibacteriota bacterium]
MSRDNLLEVKNLSKSFELETGLLSRLFAKEKNKLQALDSLNFDLKEGETLGVLGESGSGKSTLARILMGIYAPDSGEVLYRGKNIFASFQQKTDRLQLLQKMQMIFQDPYSSLDPRMTVRKIISEPLKIHKNISAAEAEKILISSLEEVGLDKNCLDKYPAEFSGGQRQRIGICRAMILNPELIIADEAVSALDVSIQAQILELLSGLQAQRNLAMIFISHDVAVVRQISDRIILLYKGNLVEQFSSECLLSDPVHPYTIDLLNSAIYLREGNALNESGFEAKSFPVAKRGCCYKEICRSYDEICDQEPPEIEVHAGHKVKCWLGKKSLNKN